MQPWPRIGQIVTVMDYLWPCEVLSRTDARALERTYDGILDRVPLADGANDWSECIGYFPIFVLKPVTMKTHPVVYEGQLQISCPCGGILALLTGSYCPPDYRGCGLAIFDCQTCGFRRREQGRFMNSYLASCAQCSMRFWADLPDYLCPLCRGR